MAGDLVRILIAMIVIPSLWWLVDKNRTRAETPKSNRSKKTN